MQDLLLLLLSRAYLVKKLINIVRIIVILKYMFKTTIKQLNPW